MYNIWRGWARGKEGTGAMWLEKNICCDHGCDITVLDGPSHPVPSFLDAFFMGGRPWLATIKSNPQIWHNCNYRKMVIDILLNVGTNLMLSCLDSSTNIAMAAAIAITTFENYDEKIEVESIYKTRAVVAKVGDIRCGNMRDLLKFYSKRLSCLCLKKMHSEARKTLPKVGKCFSCNAVKERALLSVCSRCRVNQYCSRECQVAHWPKHEKFCDEYVRAHSRFNDDVGR